MRAIDGDALKEEIDYYIREAGWGETHNEALRWCLEFIDNAPTIEPEIVRCKDCWFYRNIMYDGTPYEYGICELNPKPVVSPEFYCAFADRRTDERSD